MKRNDKLALVFSALILAVLVAMLLISGASGDNDKITICHATGSVKNPYVEITVDRSGLNGHGDHPKDIIPAPAGGCPTPEPIPTVLTTAHPPATPTRPGVVITGVANPKHPTQTPFVIYEEPVSYNPTFCCAINGEVKAIYGTVLQFVVGLDDVTRIEVKNCCAYVYKGDKLTHQVNLAGWVVEYK